MNQTRRFLYQILFWLIIWLSQWLLQEYSMAFLTNNAIVYFFQVLLIAVVVFYTAPKFLFQKKYHIFGLVSIVLITVLSFVTFDENGSLPEGVVPPHKIIESNKNLHSHEEDLNSSESHVHTHEHEHNINRTRRKKGPGIGGAPPIGPGSRFSFTIFPPSRIFINFLLLTISYFLATFFEAFNFIRKKEEEVIVNKAQNLETELKLLKSQINPHFLFNALNNIYALSAINTTKTQESISYLSNMLRYVLYECDQELVSLEKEILYVENYIKLFSLKSSKKYPIEFKKSISNPKAKVAPMLLLPYVENAFKHSNVERGGDCFISIEIYDTDNSVHFLIENSVPKQKINKDSVGGIGLKNVKKRLSILYPNKHTLNISQSGGKYAVELKIQLD